MVCSSVTARDKVSHIVFSMQYEMMKNKILATFVNWYREDGQINAPKTKKKLLGVVKNEKTCEITANNRTRVYSFKHLFCLFHTAHRYLQFEIYCSNILTTDS